MAASDRFEYSHEIHTARIPEAVTKAKFCQTINNVKLKYGLSVMVPVLLNLAAQVWKPTKYVSADWVGGNAIIFNDSLYVEEAGGAKASIFCVCDFITYTPTIDRWRLRIMWGDKEDFSDVELLWVKG